MSPQFIDKGGDFYVYGALKSIPSFWDAQRCYVEA